MKSALSFVILILSSFSAFATVYHSDGSAINVQYIHNTQAVGGDTITLPSGIFLWTTHVTITKGITIQGETTTNSDNGTANDQTILVDNLIHVPGDQGFFHCRTNAGQSLRITGITFTGVGGRGDTMYNGALRFGGASNQVRIDHCHFTGGLKHNNYIAVYSTIYGVADHLVIDNLPSQLGQQRVFNGTGNGDLEFSQPAGWGGSQFFFFEDCYINNTAGPLTASGGVDAAHGGKFVMRHCHLFNVEILCHGTEADRGRGGRAQEIYNNDYHWSYLTTMDGIRSGSLIVHDNTFYGTTPRGYGLQTYRTFWNYRGFFGGASGDNPWDYNATEPDGRHVDGHLPYLFESGTVSSGTSTTLTDTSKNWTTNQWVGYTARRLSDSVIGKVIRNTSNTLTFADAGYPKPDWANGNQYQIHKVLAALDQPCRGAGDLLVGDNPPAAWPHQQLEPCYSWNNIHSPGGEHINWAGGYNAQLLEGRDYFSDTPMPDYTLYTYPHPLVIGSPTPSSPVANPATFVASNSFKANWRSVSGATGYRLDVATNNSFTNYVAGYQNLNIGNALSRSVTGLNASTTYYYRVRAYNGNGTSGNSNVVDVTTLSPTGPSVAITNLATLIASYSATLNGSVDPHGLSTTVYFQYGPTTGYGFTTVPQTKTGNSYQSVSANISGLSASTTYHFRIVTTNSAGTRYGLDRIFTTLAATGAPVVATNPATNVATFGATLNGSLDPHGLTTSVYFQYGTTTNYGHTTPMQSQTGNTYRNIAANIGSLAANTTYHFRIVATNSAGTRFGSDMTLTTQ